MSCEELERLITVFFLNDSINSLVNEMPESSGRESKVISSNVLLTKILS